MKELTPNKIPYVPSKEKRYEISNDEFSKRRIEALRDIQHELQNEFPIPISICIFGSLVKGKVLTSQTAPNTDIDVDLKFDQEALDTLPGGERTKLRKKFDIPELSLTTITTELIRKSLIEKLEKVKEILGLINIPEKHIFVTPINSRSIQSAVNHRMMDSTWEERNAGKNADVAINLYFTLSIGGVVKKYRDKFLRELASSKDQGEANWTWDLIKESIERNERDGQIPDKIKHRFPQTIEEALKFYGVKI